MDRMNEAGDCNAQPYRVEVVVRPQTGAEKYLQGRLRDPEYKEAYETMRAEMSKHD